MRAGTIRRVLAIRFARLGDVLFTTPALAALHAALPDARIDYLCGGAARALVEHHPAVREVLHFEPGWHRPRWRLRRGALRRELAARGYDLSLVFESDRPTRDWLDRLSHAAGIRHVVSRSDLRFRGDGRRIVHSCEKHLALLRPLGLEPEPSPYSTEPGVAARAAGDALLARHGFQPDASGRPLLVGFQVGSHYSRLPDALLRRIRLRHKTYKSWPDEHWVGLGRRVVETLGARLLFTGVAGERARVSRIARAVGAPPDLAPIVSAGETDVAGMLGLLARTDAFVSVDTGPMHAATALGVPTVALFGPTNPEHHGPWGPAGGSRVVRTGIECSPCNKPERKACRVNRCLTELAPARALAALQELLPAEAQRRAVRSGR